MAAEDQVGISITGFVTALSFSLAAFSVQIVAFLLLTSAGTFENVLGPRSSPRKVAAKLFSSTAPDCTNKDAHYFLEYLKMIISIFRLVAVSAMPLLLAVNFLGGRGQNLNGGAGDGGVIGLDTLAFGNIRPTDTSRYAAHVYVAALVVWQFCRVVRRESESFVGDRQDWLRDQKPLVLFSPVPERLKGEGAIEAHFDSRLRASTAIDAPFEERSLGAIYEIPDVRKLLSLHRRHKLALGSAKTRLGEEIAEEEGKLRSKPAQAALLGFHYGLSAQQATQAVRSRNPLAACSACVDGKCACSSCSALTTTSESDVLLPCSDRTWQEEYLRRAVVGVAVLGLVLCWGVLVSSTAALGQIDRLVPTVSWLSFIERSSVLRKITSAIAGVLPSLALSVFLYLLAKVLRWLAEFRGAKLASEAAGFVQKTYFVLLFIQLVLVVAAASFFTSSFSQYISNVKTLDSVASLSALMSRNFPTAANFFFSYLTLQALSKSAAIVLQVEGLASALYNKARRCKESPRREPVSLTDWACEFPFYVTLACIGFVYCIIAPLMSAFVLLSFYLILLAKRYHYRLEVVTKFPADHGGVLYPTAVQQTYVGVYVMLAFLSALLFAVRDENGRASCVWHGCVTLVLLVPVIMSHVRVSNLFKKHAFHVSDENGWVKNIFDKEIQIGPLKIQNSLRPLPAQVVSK